MTPSNRFAHIAILIVLVSANVFAQKLTPHHISLANGKSFDLNLPDGYEISVAAQGLRRVRFMALSPDNRLFVTDMYDKSIIDGAWSTSSIISTPERDSSRRSRST